MSHSSYGAIFGNIRAHCDLKVFPFDDIETIPKTFLACLYRHIGINDHFFNLLPDAVVAETVYAGGRLGVPELKAVERETGRDLSHWRLPP
jgi:hypothetical protein